MVQSGVHYGLRARAAFRNRRSQAVLSAEDAHQPAAAATVGAGFRPGVMTKAELRRFPGRHAEYPPCEVRALWPLLLPTYTLRCLTRLGVWRDCMTPGRAADACKGCMVQGSHTAAVGRGRDPLPDHGGLPGVRLAPTLPMLAPLT